LLVKAGIMTTILQWFDPQFASVFYQMSLLTGLALVISSIGFYRVVYFISIGYAFSIVAMAVVTPLSHLQNVSWTTAMQNALLVLWGIRLGVYLVQREFQASYRKELDNVHQRSAGMTLQIKLLIWVSVSVLYVLMFSPSLFGLIDMSDNPAWRRYLFQISGLLLMGGGLILETLADKQKSDFKAQNPKSYCDVGLYRWVRCPNYLGEIAFWVGNWIIGVASYHSPLKWIASVIGVVCIVLIMMGSTKRLEKTQAKRYRNQSAYQEYIRTVPVLFPFVPVYSLQNVRVYLE
jgi:steroid 5-alpha reductase family enzyme